MRHTCVDWCPIVQGDLEIWKLGNIPLQGLWGISCGDGVSNGVSKLDDGCMTIPVVGSNLRKSYSSMTYF